MSLERVPVWLTQVKCLVDTDFKVMKLIAFKPRLLLLPPTNRVLYSPSLIDSLLQGRSFERKNEMGDAVVYDRKIATL